MNYTDELKNADEMKNISINSVKLTALNFCRIINAKISEKAGLGFRVVKNPISDYDVADSVFQEIINIFKNKGYRVLSDSKEIKAIMW